MEGHIGDGDGNGVGVGGDHWRVTGEERTHHGLGIRQAVREPQTFAVSQAPGREPDDNPTRSKPRPTAVARIERRIGLEQDCACRVVCTAERMSCVSVGFTATKRLFRSQHCGKPQIQRSDPTLTRSVCAQGKGVRVVGTPPATVTTARSIGVLIPVTCPDLIDPSSKRKVMVVASSTTCVAVKTCVGLTTTPLPQETPPTPSDSMYTTACAASLAVLVAVSGSVVPPPGDLRPGDRRPGPNRHPEGVEGVDLGERHKLRG